VYSQNPAPLNLNQALSIATTHHQAGQLAQAEQIYRQILQQNPQQVDALSLLGVIACQKGNLEEGIVLYRQALALRPGHLAARENLYLALWKRGKQLIDEAIVGYNQILNLQPDSLQTYENLGAILQEQGKLDEAIAYQQQALTVQPNNARALNSLGAALHQRGKVNSAVRYLQQAVALQPDFAEAHLNLGISLQEQGAFEEAAICFDRALELNPNHAGANYSRALLWLIEGDYQRGFAHYEWRFQTEEFPPCPFKQPLWDGSHLNGKTLLLHAEQGLGDTIQFIRYAAIAKQRGARLILTCHQPLIRLLSTIPGIEQITPLGQPLPEFHTYAPLLSLPHILGTTLETLPNQVPYLFPPAPPLPLPPCPQPFKVGIVWSGGHLYKRNQGRSCPLNYFQPLLQLSGIGFYSLQKGFAQNDLLDLGWQNQVQDLSSQLNDMADTAGAIAQLDLVITVDTSVAHLAGALGKPVWVLLSAIPDWRWMMERQDSPWYPTMRLFRQSQPGDWQEVMQRVATALQQRG
jgi:tetratricopeptide (TPR) repeat protein